MWVTWLYNSIYKWYTIGKKKGTKQDTGQDQDKLYRTKQNQIKIIIIVLLYYARGQLQHKIKTRRNKIGRRIKEDTRQKNDKLRT